MSPSCNRCITCHSQSGHQLRLAVHPAAPKTLPKGYLHMHHIRRLAVSIIALASATSTAAWGAELVGRAVLPAATFAPGPTSGQFITSANGVSVPFANKQPVQGLSGVAPGPVP